MDHQGLATVTFWLVMHSSWPTSGGGQGLAHASPVGILVWFV